MFLDEFTPVVRELTRYPVAFLSGFFSGALRLNLGDDPVKSWLEQQAGVRVNSSVESNRSSGNGSGPQSISID